MPGDRLIKFTAFAAPGDAFDWPAATGSWAVQNDTLVLSDPGTNSAGADHYTGSTPARSYAVEANVVVDAIDNLIGSSFSVVVDLDLGAQNIGCTVVHRVGVDEAWAELGNSSPATSTASTPRAAR